MEEEGGRREEGGGGGREEGGGGGRGGRGEKRGEGEEEEGREGGEGRGGRGGRMKGGEEEDGREGHNNEYYNDHTFLLSAFKMESHSSPPSFLSSSRRLVNPIPTSMSSSTTRETRTYLHYTVLGTYIF